MKRWTGGFTPLAAYASFSNGEDGGSVVLGTPRCVATRSGRVHFACFHERF